MFWRDVQGLQMIRPTDMSVNSYHPIQLKQLQIKAPMPGLSGPGQSMIHPIQGSWSLHLICCSPLLRVWTPPFEMTAPPPKTPPVSLFQTLNKKKSLKLQIAYFYLLWTWPLTFRGFLNSLELAGNASTFRTTQTRRWRRTLLKHAFRFQTDCKSFESEPYFCLTLLLPLKKNNP